MKKRLKNSGICQAAKRMKKTIKYIGEYTALNITILSNRQNVES